jgi:hypothetical protein
MGGWLSSYMYSVWIIALESREKVVYGLYLLGTSEGGY